MGFHAVPRGYAYSVRKTGAKRAKVVGLTQRVAWREAKRLAEANNGSAYLFGTDGRMMERVEYGTDR
jgi:hypothetical protein